MVLEAVRAVLALPEVLVDLARPLVLAELAVLPRLPVAAQPPVLVDPLVEAAVSVEEAPVELLCRSFSAAMVGSLPSAGTPRFSPVPRSGRKAKRRPCPLA